MISITTILASAINMLAVIIIWHKMLNVKTNFKSIKTYILLFALVLISIFSYYALNPFIRISLFTIFLMISFKIYFKANINQTILTVIFEQMIMMVSELAFAIIITFIFKMNSTDIVNTQFGSFVANASIAAISIAVAYIPFINKFYKFLIRITDKIKRYHLIVLSFIVIIIANILTMILYYKVEFGYLLIFNTLLTLFCFFIVLYSFKTKNNYISVYDKYNTTLNSLKEYEGILDRYRISNHENKNQILTIRNMVSKKNIKVINYIDTIVEDKLKDNDKVMLETSKIPAGGLRGLIYSKVLQMKKLKINYKLDISNEVKTVDLINNIDDSTMLDICKIIGVYMDNSIQAVENLKKKHISIEMYVDKENLIIAVSNNYEGVIELDKLDEKGYTSKGKGHGYGLTLTKEIIENNKKLGNDKRISKEIFTQVLKIKM